MSDFQVPSVSIDFQKIPLEEAAAILRAIGQTLFEGLMAPKPQLTWPKKWPEQTYKLWTTQELWPGPGSDKKKKVGRLKKMWKRAGQRYRLKQIMSGKTDWDRFRGTFRQDAIRAMKVDTYLGLTQQMWQLAAEAAWQDVHFQHMIFREVDRRLRSEVLLMGGRPPHAYISSKALWALVALAAKQPLKRRERRTIEPALRQLRTGLGALANRIVMEPDWAGFWDQWLLIRALPTINIKFQAQDTPMVRAIKNLPLRKTSARKLVPDYDVPPQFLLLRLWWFWRRSMAEMFAQFRRWRAKSLPQLGLADPDWKQQKPIWAEKIDMFTGNF